MMNAKKFISILFTTLFLSACGGGSSGSDDTPATLSNLVGVWDETVTEGQLVDEKYTVIKADGTIVEYDYLGDSFDNIANCYVVYSSTLQDLGDGKFLYDDTENLDISINGDTYTVTNDSADITFTGTRTTQVESDFDPICTIDDFQ